MFNKKTKEIERLNRVLADRNVAIQNLRFRVAAAETRADSLQIEIEELENTTQASYDMNILFASVIDYRNVLKRLCAPDPVAARGDVQRVFNKYRVKF